MTDTTNSAPTEVNRAANLLKIEQQMTKDGTDPIKRLALAKKISEIDRNALSLARETLEALIPEDLRKSPFADDTNIVDVKKSPFADDTNVVDVKKSPFADDSDAEDIKKSPFADNSQAPTTQQPQANQQPKANQQWTKGQKTPKATQPQQAPNAGNKPVSKGTWRNKVAPDRMTTTSQDFEDLLSGKTGSTFEKVYDAMVAYEGAQTRAKKEAALQKLNQRASNWVNQHTDSDRDLDLERRRAMLENLVDQVGVELARLSKSDAQDRYVGNVDKSRKDANYKSKDPNEKYAFKALTNEAVSDVRKNVIGKKQAIPNPYGLTDAEIAAIRIFTGDDFGYINPSTVQSTTWLDDNKSNVTTSAAFSRGGATDDDRMSEGPVHVGVAVSGLQKLPAYTGDVYRGASASRNDVKDWIANGLRFDALASATKKRRVAEDFAFDNVKDSKPIPVLFIIHNCGGRDIRDLSVNAKEDEVTLLPGSTYTNVTARQLDKKGSKGYKFYEIEVSP